MLEIQKESTLRNQLMDAFEKFIEISGKLNTLLLERKEINKLKMLKEMKGHLEDNDFEVIQSGDNLVAHYADITVRLENSEGEDENHIFYNLQIQPNDIYNAVLYKVCKKDEKALYWKNIIKINNKYIDLTNHREVIMGICNIRELEKILREVKENTSHYEKSIENIDDMKYVYSFYRNEGAEFATFEEAFKYASNN